MVPLLSPARLASRRGEAPFARKEGAACAAGTRRPDAARPLLAGSGTRTKVEGRGGGGGRGLGLRRGAPGMGWGGAPPRRRRLHFFPPDALWGWIFIISIFLKLLLLLFRFCFAFPFCKTTCMTRTGHPPAPPSFKGSPVSGGGLPTGFATDTFERHLVLG